MTLTLRLFGLEILHVEASTDPPDDEDEDTERDLSGGTLTAERIDAGPTDRWMGFTNGRGDDE
jgi:hypothetical protein